jgi:RNA-directed DNA polymerase
MCEEHRRAEQAGVRAGIVAKKCRNWHGAKGPQEGGSVKDRKEEGEPAGVPGKAKQAGEAQEKWSWAEPLVWTERMLSALENGVKGGKWFSLMDKVYAPRNLRRAFEQVKARKGGAGVDHQTIEMYEERLEENLGRLEESLRRGRYKPQAIKRVWIPKAGSKEKRPLGIPTVQDRVVQRALLNVIEPIFERDYGEESYGFRPGRGTKDALRRVDQLMKEGNEWVVDADLKSYFDTIPHEGIKERVREKIADGRVVSLIEGYLKQGVMEGMAEWEPEEGSPQGAVISPLLSNSYLDPLDHLMEGKGWKMVRYADDIVILCRSKEEAQEALREMEQWVKEAGLTLHPEKTRIVDVRQRGGYDFLGYHFERGMKWARKKSLKKLKDTIRGKTRRTNGQSLEAIISELNPVLRGWFNYFKHSEPNTLEPLDGWIRMRLRSILRKRAKRRGRGRGADHQRWPNAFFSEQGLYSLVGALDLVRQSLREG